MHRKTSHIGIHTKKGEMVMRKLITNNRIKTREAYKSNKPGDYNEDKFEDWIMLVE